MPAKMQERITALVIREAKQTLENCGFTSVSLEASTPSSQLINWLDDGEGDYEAEDVIEFARTSGYHRVETSQGTFAILFWPHIVIDLIGSDINPSVLWPAGLVHDPDSEDRYFVPLMDDDTLRKLLAEFNKKSRQP